MGFFLNSLRGPTVSVSVQIGGRKAAVGATLVVALLANPDIGGTPAGRPQARLDNPDIGGTPAGRPQGSPLQQHFLHLKSERLQAPRPLPTRMLAVIMCHAGGGAL